MWWLWLAGPIVVLVIFLLTGRPDGRRGAEVERWRKEAGNPRRVTSMPGPLTRILETTGGGKALGYYELVAKLAYLTILGADALQGSDHVTVVARLDEGGPTFTARPLPIIEGERMANTGVQFKKDPDFMAAFLVEPTLEDGPPVTPSEPVAKAVRKWLSPPLREALLDLPDLWLRVDGKAKVMALTLYGPIDADRASALIAAADIVFAEYGADGGPSLFPEDEGEAPAKAPPPKKKKKAGKADAAEA